jgi:SET domain-containing protein
VRERRVFIYAKRNISAGEELCYDNGKAYFDEFIKPKGCACERCSPRRKLGRGR